jgi:colanic acid/amylovoran biosynthesis glycosyltransferase
MRIAYVVPTPQLFTFVANEMIGVQEARHDIIVVPLHSASLQPCRRTPLQLKLTTLPAALFDFKVLCLAIWVFFTRPHRVLGTLFPLHWNAGLNIFAHASLIAMTPKALATGWRLYRARVDRIHAHFASHTATFAGIAGKVSGIPFSFTAHAYDIYCRTLKLRNETLIWKLHHAVQVFAVSQYAAKLLRQKLPSASDRIYTLYVGIQMDLFQEEPPLPMNGGLRLLCITYLYEKKGLDTLIDACALLRDQRAEFHLWLYGDGPMRDMLDTQITRLGLSDYVTLGGVIPQEEVARRLRTCHLFVMPCREDKNGDMDGIPTVFMEAMATGRPVISCPISGIPELVCDGQTGLLVPPDDPSALAAAILRLANDNSLRIRLGRQARVLAARQHDQRLNASRLLALMSGVSVPNSSDKNL